MFNLDRRRGGHPTTIRTVSLVQVPSSPVRVLPALLLVLAYSGACDQAQERTAIVNEWDSAGVRIIENQGPPIGPGPWTISSQPDLVIGGGDRYELWQVAGAASLSDGRVVVVCRGTHEVLLFGAEGEILRIFGKEGEGPGEFSYMELAGILTGDTIVVSDLDLQRITLLHPDSGFVRSAPISRDLQRWNWTLGLMGRRLMRGGLERYELSSHPPGQKGTERILTSFETCSLEGSKERDFGTFPFRDIYHDLGMINGHRTEVAYDVPFGVEASFAVSEGSFFFGSGDKYEIEVFDPTGRLSMIIRWGRDRVPVTSEDLDALLRLRESAAETSEEASVIRRELEAVPAGDLFPSYLGFEIDRSGFLWVRDYPRPSVTDQVYHIFDPLGKMSGTLALPVGIEILEIGVDHLLDLYRDEFDVEYIHRYKITRPFRSE